MWDLLLLLSSPHTPPLYSIPPIVLCPWLALIYCVKVYSFEITKVWNNCLACHRGYRSWEHLCVTKMKHSLTIWFCRDELSFAMLFWEDMISLISMLEVLLFLCQYELLSWIFRIWIFMPQLIRITLKLCQVALRIKNSLFIIYLLDDEQELSLGMLDTSPTYL